VQVKPTVCLPSCARSCSRRGPRPLSSARVLGPVYRTTGAPRRATRQRSNSGKQQQAGAEAATAAAAVVVSRKSCRGDAMPLD